MAKKPEKTRIESLRAKLIQGCENSADHICEIAKGNAEMTVIRSSNGTPVELRVQPTFAERIAAFEVLAKFGAGVIRETSSDAGGGAQERTIYTFE